MSASKQMGDGEDAHVPNLITYEDLPPEHQQKFDELLEIFKADLIGSYERTRTNGIRWKGFNLEGAQTGSICPLHQKSGPARFARSSTTWWRTRCTAILKVW